MVYKLWVQVRETKVYRRVQLIFYTYIYIVVIQENVIDCNFYEHVIYNVCVKTLYNYRYNTRIIYSFSKAAVFNFLTQWIKISEE